jgi:hypothetical protein
MILLVLVLKHYKSATVLMGEISNSSWKPRLYHQNLIFKKKNSWHPETGLYRNYFPPIFGPFLDFFQEWACLKVLLYVELLKQLEQTIISVMRNFEELVYGRFCIIFLSYGDN